MKDKKIYDLINKVKTNEPEELMPMSKDELETLKKNIYAKLGKKQPIKKSRFFKIAIVSLILIVIFSMSKPGSQVIAHIKDIYHTIVNPIATYSLDSEGTDDYISNINKSVTDAGIKMTLKEAFRDGKNIYVNVTYQVVGEDIINKFDPDGIILPANNSTLLINGKDRFPDGKPYNRSSGTIMGTIADNRTNQQFYRFTLKEEVDLSDEDILTIYSPSATIFDYSLIDFSKENWGLEDLKTIEVEGDWSIDFMVEDSRDKLEPKVYKANKILYQDEEKGQVVKLTNIEINPFMMKLKIRQPFDASIGNLSLEIIDDSNKRYLAKYQDFKEIYTSENSNKTNGDQPDLIESIYVICGDTNKAILESKYLKIRPVIVRDYFSREYEPLEDSTEISIDL